MAITISGTTGVAGVDGSASAPSLIGTDSNSGVYFGADVIKFSTGGTERMSITNTGFTGITEGKILQVLQAFKSDAYTRTSDSTSTTIPGLSQAITMTAASNKVLCMAQVQATCGGNYGGHVLNLVRGSTAIGIATSGGSRTLGGSAVTPNGNYPHSHVLNYLDTPGAGTHTYTVQDYDPSSSNVIYINRSVTDSDDAGYQRTASSLILLEVAA